MKNVIIAVLLLFSVATTAQDKDSESLPVLNNELDSLSYFLGLSLGYDFQSLPFEENLPNI